MHTAFGLKSNMFAITQDGAPTSREALLDWDVRDRLGVLVSEPFGALGAGLLIQLVITAFYDAPGKRRRMQPLYPDIFLFHLGGPFGCHIAFDFWPDHKEIFVAPDPREILRAINNRGITHLVVPERPRRQVVHRFKEPEAARDRIKRCFVYDPAGSANGANVIVETSSPEPLVNFEAVLNARELLERRLREPANASLPSLLRATPPEEIELSLAYQRRRLDEVPQDHPVRQRASRRLAHARAIGNMSEQLRLATTEEVLEMLA